MSQTQRVILALPATEDECDRQGKHVSADDAAMPIEYVFSLHIVHPPEPGDTLYHPAAQGVHVSPSGPE